MYSAYLPGTVQTLILIATGMFVLFLIGLTIYFVTRDYSPNKTADGADANKDVSLRQQTIAIGEHEVENEVVCNEITSTSIVTMNDNTGRLRHACRCHWPTLFGQKNLFSDCNVRHACDGGKGILVHKTTRRPLTESTPPLDVHDYECSACDLCNVPGPDPHTGLPSCLPRPFNDRERDMCVYDVESDSAVYSDATDDRESTEDYRTTKTMLAVGSRFVDRRFLSSFTDRVRNTAWVPNPCSFDLFTGARLEDSCELRMTRKSNIAYCAPLRDDTMTAVKDDTYLMNNRGNYSNACFRLSSNEEHVKGFVIEYFLRKREGEKLPSPVVSTRIAKEYVLDSVLSALGLTREPKGKMLLFTQPEYPADVSEFPHPYNARRMEVFKKELNFWHDSLPAKCTSFLGKLMLYNCSAPVQPLNVPECSRVGEWDRSPSNKIEIPLGIGDQTEEYAKTTVACTKPDYDTRFPIVPNYNVKVGSIDAEPTSAILYFDKTDNTVYPHWKDAGEKVSGELNAIRRYVREALRSLPNESWN